MYAILVPRVLDFDHDALPESYPPPVGVNSVCLGNSDVWNEKRGNETNLSKSASFSCAPPPPGMAVMLKRLVTSPGGNAGPEPARRPRADVRGKGRGFCIACFVWVCLMVLIFSRGLGILIAILILIGILGILIGVLI